MEHDIVEPLWKKLNELHRLVSPHFSDRAAAHSFTARKQGFLEKTQNGQLRVEVVKTKAEQQVIAYCVSTITPDKTGEIDSIFVEEDHRGNGIADQGFDNIEQFRPAAKVLIRLHTCLPFSRNLVLE